MGRKKQQHILFKNIYLHRYLVISRPTVLCFDSLRPILIYESIKLKLNKNTVARL